MKNDYPFLRLLQRPPHMRMTYLHAHDTFKVTWHRNACTQHLICIHSSHTWRTSFHAQIIQKRREHTYMHSIYIWDTDTSLRRSTNTHTYLYLELDLLHGKPDFDNHPSNTFHRRASKAFSEISSGNGLHLVKNLDQEHGNRMCTHFRHCSLHLHTQNTHT